MNRYSDRISPMKIGDNPFTLSSGISSLSTNSAVSTNLPMRYDSTGTSQQPAHHPPPVSVPLNVPPPGLYIYPPDTRPPSLYSHPPDTQQRPPAPGGEASIPILCMSTCSSFYAENSVQRTFARHGLGSHVLFPNDRVPLLHHLDKLITAGESFAVTVYKHSPGVYAMNLYVLKGSKEEIIQIAPEVAVEKIKLNIELNKQFQKISNSEVASLINMLKAGKVLTLLEVDQMIKHLVSLRNLALKEQYGNNVPKCVSVPPVGPHDPEQKRILEKIEDSIMEIFKSAEDPRSQTQPTNRTGENAALMQAIDNVISSLNVSKSGGMNGRPFH